VQCGLNSDTAPAPKSARGYSLPKIKYSAGQRMKANNPRRHLELLVGAVLLKELSEQPISSSVSPSRPQLL
jgi:hypothetical protein